MSAATDRGPDGGVIPHGMAGGSHPSGRWLVAAIEGAGRSLALERPYFAHWLPVVFGAGIASYFSLSAEPALPAALVLLGGALFFGAFCALTR